MAIKHKAVFKKETKPKKEHASNYHKDGFKMAILTSGKKLIFRQATMKDQKKASRFAEIDGAYNTMNFVIELLKLLFLKAYRANGDEINCDKLDLFEDILALKESNELLSLADAVADLNFEKKSCARVI